MRRGKRKLGLPSCRRADFERESALILLVADFFQPVGGLAVELFLDGDVREAVEGAAPCQCFSPGGNQMTSPGRISSTGPPQRWRGRSRR